jgi:hypothetical protein
MIRERPTHPIDPTHDILLDRLSAYAEAAERVLREWDTYTTDACDERGHPHDEETYARHQRRRDADTWAAFEPVLPYMRALLTVGFDQLADTPDSQRRPNWKSSMTLLDEDRVGLEDVHAVWLAWQRAHPDVRAGDATYEEHLTERNANAWGYLYDWSLHGHVLIELALAAPKRSDAVPQHARTRDGAAPPPQGPGRPHPGHRPPHR